MIELTHNTYVTPGSITLIRFAMAPKGTPKTGKDADMMALEVWCGPICVIERVFDGANPVAFRVAQERMSDLVTVVRGPAPRRLHTLHRS